MQNTRSIFARNLRMIMDYHNITQAALAERTGISQKTISNILNLKSVHSPSMDIIETLAEHFGLESYHLIIPDLPTEELLTNTIEEIVEYYAKLPPDGRESIRRVATHEARYAHIATRSLADRRKTPRLTVDRRTHKNHNTH